MDDNNGPHDLSWVAGPAELVQILQRTLAERDAEIDRLRARGRELEAACTDEARLNGMGSEREARLLAHVAELEEVVKAVHGVLDEHDDINLPDEHCLVDIEEVRAAMAARKADG